MLIGAISDTHDNLPLIEKAVHFLNQQNIGLVLHAGDYVAGFVIPILAKLNCPLIGVFGNNDGEKLFLREKFAELGFELHQGPHEFELQGRKICLMHEPRCLASLVKSGDYDLIVHGHTHELAIHEEGTLVINPGEACGYLTGKPTCAVVDLDDLSGRFIEL